MYRNIYQDLQSWKEDAFRKPLIIYGARQIGKTYSMLEFGNQAYSNVAYFNFENSKTLSQVFDPDLDPKRILAELSLLKGVQILPEKTLIIFDEIQVCERALTFLKYLYEEANEYHLIAAGSLLGLALNRDEFSFPVGKVDLLYMYPMTFDEFLIALDMKPLKDMIEESVQSLTPMSNAMHQKAIEFYRTYLVIGGYPEAVSRYLKKSNFDYVRAIQGNIADAYLSDMAKYSTPSDTVKAMAAYNSLPAQLAKENSKFMYSVIGSSARAKDYEKSIDWLVKAGVVIKCNRASEGKMPLKLYEDPLSFKMYDADVGLFAMKAGISPENLLHNLGLSDKMRGIMAENYVAQELHGKGHKIFYWTLNHHAEVDFLMQLKDDVIPVEVKSSDNVKARSLASYTKIYHPAYSLRISTRNIGFENEIKSIPLYGVFAL